VKTAEILVPPEKIEPQIAQPESKASKAERPKIEARKPSAQPLPKNSADNQIVEEDGIKLAKPPLKQKPAEPLQIDTGIGIEKNKLDARKESDIAGNDDKRGQKNIPAAEKKIEISKSLEAQMELAKFEAQLNGNNVAATGDGSTGTTGPKLRKGERGHEGNGVIRPGDDNAVSDVTTVNLSSSATETGDPRFAKRFDAKTAYIKMFSRHVDAKWKADIHAYLRNRLIPGSVSIRVVLRKDGVLIEASESHRDRGMPDEYVASAKRAVQEAADPTADPFPAALAGRESIEYTFVFLYQ